MELPRDRVRNFHHIGCITINIQLKTKGFQESEILNKTIYDVNRDIERSSGRNVNSIEVRKEHGRIQ